jgi:hypothetical protein
MSWSRGGPAVGLGVVALVALAVIACSSGGATFPAGSAATGSAGPMTSGPATGSAGPMTSGPATPTPPLLTHTLHPIFLPTSPSTPTPPPNLFTLHPGLFPTAKPTPTKDTSLFPCAGGAAMKSFFAATALVMPFDIYCAVLPPDWSVATYGAVPFKSVWVRYIKQSDGSQIYLFQGSFCEDNPASCAAGLNCIQPANFGDLSGWLCLDTVVDEYKAILESASTSHEHRMITGYMTQGQTVTYGAALWKVPKS